jgi:hypothetical protein
MADPVYAQVVAITGKSYRVKAAPAVTQEAGKGRKTNETPTAGPRAKGRSSAPARLNSKRKSLDRKDIMRGGWIAKERNLMTNDRAFGQIIGLVGPPD